MNIANIARGQRISRLSWKLFMGLAWERYLHSGPMMHTRKLIGAISIQLFSETINLASCDGSRWKCKRASRVVATVRRADEHRSNSVRVSRTNRKSIGDSLNLLTADIYINLAAGRVQLSRKPRENVSLPFDTFSPFPEKSRTCLRWPNQKLLDLFSTSCTLDRSQTFPRGSTISKVSRYCTRSRSKVRGIINSRRIIMLTVPESIWSILGMYCFIGRSRVSFNFGVDCSLFEDYWKLPFASTPSKRQWIIPEKIFRKQTQEHNMLTQPLQGMNLRTFSNTRTRVDTRNTSSYTIQRTTCVQILLPLNSIQQYLPFFLRMQRNRERNVKGRQRLNNSST